MTTLFDPLRFGAIAVANRIAMAPMTRNRAYPGRLPGDLHIEYYRQRASAGLIVTEATQISPEGQGYLDTPGIYETAQVADYRRAAGLAMLAGFDGVEVHGANGYLLVQFLRDSINDRSDAYGGPIAHRVRLLDETMQAICAEIGADRTGVRLSPVTPSNDAGQDSDPAALFGHVIDRLAPLRLAFVHVIEGQTGGARDYAPFDFAALHARFKRTNPNGAWIVNNGYERAQAAKAVENGAADMVAFGRPFIANPDLVRRLREDAPLNAPQRETFYGGGTQGYTDYPTLEAAPAERRAARAAQALGMRSSCPG